MKKIIKIACASLGCVLLSALLAFGIFTLIKNRNVAKTGNVLGVSWYNETDKTFTIATVEELYEFSALSKFYDFKGQTIKLDADLVVNEGNAADWGENAPKKKWRPIDKFAGTFDGQGHTISGLYAKTSGTAFAMFTNTSQSCTIKNMKLVNTYFETRGLGGLASFASVGGGKFYQLYSDAILECKGEKVAGIMSMVKKAAKFEECWFDGEIHTTNRDAGGLVDDIYASRVEMKHCLFSGTLTQDYTIGGTRTGGICGKVRDGSSLIMNDCLATGKLIAEKTVYSGALVGVVYGGCQLATTDCYVSSNVYNLLIGESGDQGSFNGLPLQMPNDVLIGTKAYEWTTLNFDQYWAAVEGDTPVLKCFGEKGISLAGVEKAFDTSWYIPGMNIYEITTLKQLYGLYILSGSNNFAENTIKLGADIVVNEGNAADWAKNAPKNPWFAINKFAGIFDGQGHTISGIYLKNQMGYQGFFGQVEPTGIVRNFNLKNSYFCNDGDKKLAMLGSVAGEFRGKLENVYSNAIVECSGIQAGGIFGRTNDNDDDGKEDKVVITNCWFDGELRMKGQGGRYGGGFVGMVVQGDLDITHCLNTGRISAEATNIGVHVGGFVGSTMNKGVINMDDCLSAGTMDMAYGICVGSVFGRSEGETRTVNLTNVYATQECYPETFFGTGEGGATTAKVNGGAIPLPEKMLTGYTAYQWTELDFANNWAVVKDGTPILRNFAKSVPSIAGQKKMIDLKWYQVDKKSYTVKTANELRGLALLSNGDSFKDKTIKLGADINLGKNIWMTIGTINDPFLGTFDGQGHTISGVKFDTKEYYGGLFGVVGSGATLKNFRLTDSEFTYSGEGSAILGSVVADLYGGATLKDVYSNATVVSCGSQVGGLVGRVNDNDEDKKQDKAVISNCWFDGTLTLTGEETIYGGGITGRLFRGDLDMSHCLNTGALSTEATGRALQFGGLVGAVNEVGTFNLSDSLNVGKITATYDNGVGSAIGRVSCTEKNDRIVNIKNTYGSKESYKSTLGNYSATSQINGATVPLAESLLTGYKAYEWTTLDFAKNWAVVEDDTPILQKFASKVPSVESQNKAVDLGWYDAGATTYEIETAEEFRGLALIACGDTFKGKTITLKANIDLEDENWIPIGTESKNFLGTFDGAGHTISGVSLDTKEYYGGLFGVIGDGSVVKNFRLEDSEFTYSGTGSAILGSVVGDLMGGATLENVYSNATVVSCGSQVGGIIGRVNDNDTDGKEDKVIVKNCWFDGTLTMTGVETIYGGGITGRLFRGDLDMSNCLNTGAISSEAKDRATQVGGLIGAVNDYGTLNLTGSLSAGAISTQYDIGTGAVVGRVSCDDATIRTVNIEDTYATENSYKVALGTSTAYTSKGVVVTMPNAMLTGYKAYQWTELDFEDSWAVVKDKTPVPQVFASEVPSLSGYDKLYDVDWYDADKTNFELKTEEEFRGLSLIAFADNFKGKTITLKADMDLEEEAWLPIGPSGMAFAGTFDGQMHTIEGMNVNTTSQYAGMFGQIDASGVVKNFYLTDSVFKSTNYDIGSVAGVSYGTVDTVYSNATVIAEKSRVGGIVGHVPWHNTTAYIKNCWFDGEMDLGNSASQAGGILGYVANEWTAGVRITNCLYTGSIDFGITSTNWGIRIGGIVGGARDYYTPTITIENCISAGEIVQKGGSADTPAVSSVYGGFDEYRKTTLTLTNVYGTNECFAVDRIYHLYKANGSGTAIENAPIITGTGTMLDKAVLKGVSGYQNTDLDFGSTWVARADKVPGLKVFTKVVGETLEVSGVVKPDTSWYKASEVRQEIVDEADMYGFMKLMAEGNTFTGKEVYLMNDLNMNVVSDDILTKWKAGVAVPDNKWSAGLKFAGTFDGQMHTIKGLYLNSTSQYAGMFGQIEAKGVVKNFYLTDSFFKSTSSDVGSVAGVSYGTVDTVYSNATVIAEGYRSGGIVGHVPWHNTTAYIKNCWFDGEMELKNSACQAGGILGYVANEWTAGVSITNCLYTGSIDFEATSTNWGLRIGGIVGGARDYYTPTITIENCISAGEIVQKGGSTNTPAVSSVYGGFDELRATTLNLINVYGTNECFTPARIYHQYKASGSTANATLTINGNGALLDEAALQGVSGYQNTNLDFATTWAARANEVPGLKVFTKIVTESLDVSKIVKPDTSWYDEDVKVQEISDEADMYGFMKLMSEGNTFSGKEIHLKADLNMNKLETGTVDKWKAGTEEPENKWIAGLKFAGTFDGEMHTIRGIYLNTSSQYAGLFGQIDASGVVKNFYLTDSFFKSTSSDVGSVAGVSYGTVDTVYSNSIVIAEGYRSGGIVGHVPWHNTTAYIKNCWFDGEMQLKNSACQAGGILGYIANEWKAGVSITDCLFTGSIDFEATSADWGLRIGGIVGGSRDYYTPTITIENCLSAGTITQKAGSTSTPAVSVVYGGFDELRATTLNLINVYGTNECFAEARIYHAYKASGSTASATLNINGKGSMKARTDFLGTAGYQNTLLDFEDTWVARKDNVPGLAAFTKVLGETVSIANVEQNNWYNADETVFGIGSASALKSLGTYTNATNKLNFKDKTIYLTDDIEVNQVEEGTMDAWKTGTGTLPASWTPIGVGAAFNGTFNGQMHTISGVYLNTSSQYAGLFGQIDASGVVKNFYLTDSLFKSTSYDVGSVAGVSYGTVDTVYSNANIIAEKQRSGGIVGHVPWHNTTAYIKNCWFDGQMDLGNSASQAGGILGYIANEWKAGVSITNCLFTGSIEFGKTSEDWGIRIGGIVGGARDYYTPTITIENCMSAGTITHKTGSTSTPAVSAVYGGFDELRATTLNLTNVYGTNECFAEARIYHAYKASGSTANATLTINGKGTMKAKADFLGTLGYQNTFLDFEDTWVARKDNVPGLKAFGKVLGETVSIANVERATND